MPGCHGATVDVEADALTGVTVAATHRRRGLLSRMIAQSLQYAKDAGDPFSVLIAAEWPIYGRYGYAPAAWAAHYTYSPRQPRRGRHTADGGRRAPGRTCRTRCRLRPLSSTGLGAFGPGRSTAATAGGTGGWRNRRSNRCPARRRTGSSTRAPARWTACSPGNPAATSTWTARSARSASTSSSLRTTRRTATCGRTCRAWTWSARSNCAAPPVDEPVRWLLAEAARCARPTAATSLWLRLLDVPAALSARGYACAGDVVLEVVDDDPAGTPPAVTGWPPTSTARHARRPPIRPTWSCRSARSRPLYLGGTSLRSVASPAASRSGRRARCARIDAMFATALLPWNATGF